MKCRILPAMLIGLLSLPATVLAEDGVLFRCTTTHGKSIMLSQNNDTLHYRFGPVDKPELAFSNQKADTDSGSCSGNNSSHSWVLLRNGGYDYMISTHDHTGKPSQATLDVYRSNAKASSATLACRSGSVRHQLSRLNSIISPCGQ